MHGKAMTFLRERRDSRLYGILTGPAVSFGVTALFALYHGYLGLSLTSVWHGGICIFYLLLTAIRGIIFLTEKLNRTLGEKERAVSRRRTFFISSALLLALDLALILPIAMMVVMERPVDIGLIPAIAMATYTTYKVTIASVRVRRQRRSPDGDILISELRTVNFIDALVSVLTLQNTLIMVNQDQAGEDDMFILSAVSSAAIYAVIVFVTAYMMVKGSKRA